MSVGIGELSTETDEAMQIAACTQRLVIANRVLLFHQIVDAFGHVSARHPTRPDRFLMARRIAPGLVQQDDIREFGLDGDLIEDDGTLVFLERFIHSAIYIDRPDVHAIVHSHSSAVISFGVVRGQPLRPVCHGAGFLHGPVPIFDLSDIAGPATDLMIRNQTHGHALAAALGQGRLVLMRGHGSTTVGQSVPHAVYNAIYAETNARIQASALALGTVTYLTPEESRATDSLSSIAIERTWEFWKQEVARRYA
jgi:ribulose-5-phosphate 4-epimerase/fuculose-1-phosphate aldolase